MKHLLLTIIAFSILVQPSYAKPSISKHVPATAESIIWEVRREIPVSKVCPSQAAQYDSIAYLTYGDRGYVCLHL